MQAGRGAGVVLIAAGAGLALLVVLLLWPRLSSSSAVLLLAAAGMTIGAGALLLQEGAGPADWAVTLVVLAVVGPVHFRWLLGPPGPGASLARAWR